MLIKQNKNSCFEEWGVLKHDESWTYQGQQIEVVSFYKYLGFLNTLKLFWSKTIEMLSRQALNDQSVF